MANPMGESESDALWLDSDPRLKLEFHGSNEDMVAEMIGNFGDPSVWNAHRIELANRAASNATQ